MKLFKNTKILLSIAALSLVMGGCDFLNTAEDDAKEAVSNTDEEGRVNGDENFNPEDVISDECADLGEGETSKELQDKCLDEFKDAFNPGNLSADCESDYKGLFDVASQMLELGCEGGPDDMMDSSKAATDAFDDCMKAEQETMESTDAFFKKCEDELGEGFVLPWMDHDDDHMHEDPNKCDPMMDDCNFEDPYKCDPMVDDCPVIDPYQCDPMKEDCNFEDPYKCDPMVDDCPVIDPYQCDPAVENCMMEDPYKCDPMVEECFTTQPYDSLMYGEEVVTQP